MRALPLALLLLTVETVEIETAMADEPGATSTSTRSAAFNKGASDLAESATKLYQAEQFRAALELFRAAYRLDPRPSLLFNQAKCHERLGETEDALTVYQRFLETAPDATNRGEVEIRIAGLKKLVNQRYLELEVSSAPSGADVYIDEQSSGLRGQTDLRFKVPPGHHALYLEANGYEPVKKEFVMPDDQPLRLQFELKKLERTGALEVKVNRPGVRIFVDGAIVGLSPFTQKWILSEGQHQVLVETEEYKRLAQNVIIKMGETMTAKFKFRENEQDEEEDEGSDLPFWGETLLVASAVVLIGGVAGPILYEKSAIGRTPYTNLGPAKASEMGPYYRGPSDPSSSLQANGQLKTLQNVQVGSVIAGSALAAGGLTIIAIHLIRGGSKGDEAGTISGVGLTPGQGGASIQIGGRF